MLIIGPVITLLRVLHRKQQKRAQSTPLLYFLTFEKTMESSLENYFAVQNSQKGREEEQLVLISCGLFR